MNLQCMNVSVHQVAKGSINHAMALNPATVQKCVGDNGDVKMPTPVLRAGVPGMQMSLIFDKQVRWFECAVQERLNLSYPFTFHGSTQLNGLTVTLR